MAVSSTAREAIVQAAYLLLGQAQLLAGTRLAVCRHGQIECQRDVRHVLLVARGLRLPSCVFAAAGQLGAAIGMAIGSTVGSAICMRSLGLDAADACSCCLHAGSLCQQQVHSSTCTPPGSCET